MYAKVNALYHFILEPNIDGIKKEDPNEESVPLLIFDSPEQFDRFVEEYEMDIQEVDGSSILTYDKEGVESVYGVVSFS